MILCGCSSSRIDALCYLAGGWPDHLVDVWFALWEIFEPCTPDCTGGEAGGFAICSFHVAHETACPGFDLFDFRQEYECKKLREADFEEDQE